MNIMEKVAEVSPEKYQFLLGSAPAIQESPFRDEIVQEMDDLTKQAGTMLNSLGQGMAGLGKQVAVGVGGGIAMALAGDMYVAAKRGLTKSRYYKNMLDANPELRKLPAKDVQNAFNILHQFNPEYASNPTVAGSFVTQQANYPQFDTKVLGELVSSHKSQVDSSKLPSGKWDLGKKTDPREEEMKDIQLQKARGDMGRQNAQDALSMGNVGQAARARMDQFARENNRSGGSFHSAPSGGQRTKR